ncbi:hypothetical protein ASPZODRAFT_150714 [Penicilliopsis zonata CBS 506.65]|uniref:Ribosomal protein n=1 Tax=Penicilliopsis zonata CBS 506.65 TaxID=1073090 RepID=A0A1L9SMR9_9EURO|nr:hypothetical protein ASPZODRAFT_150714 [Penicilliopsis zonata CBS 506.65]OJJ48500.1 hypothetical protein ASPZODRAFT_150714 [Penicilliopsis zonata CBS 506.65]
MASYTAFLPSAARGVLPSCRVSLRERSIAPFLSVFQQQARGAKTSSKVDPAKAKRDNRSKDFKQQSLKDMEKFALCDAIRYIRAFEVGRDPSSTKYEVHIRLKSMRNGPVIRNMLRFPHAVQTESRICVICPPGSRSEKEALAAGAALVGEKDVFDAVKNGVIEFDRLICHPDSLEALNKASLGRILGPKGLMPSAKTGTVVEDVAMRVDMLRGGTIYRERDAVIRLPIGLLAFSPEQLRDNLRATLDQIKKDAAAINHIVNKEIYEVVLSSTHGPGLTLNGDFKSENSPSTADLSVL